MVAENLPSRVSDQVKAESTELLPARNGRGSWFRSAWAYVHAGRSGGGRAELALQEWADGSKLRGPLAGRSEAA